MKQRIILIILLIVVLSTVSFIVLKKISFNSNEKELLSVLRDFDNSLQNIEATEDNTYSIIPSEPTTLKQYVNHIYEARKYIVENGTLFFLFRVELTSEIGNSDNILIVSNGTLVARTINEESYSNLNISTDDFTSDLTSSLQKIFFKKVTSDTLDRWEKSEIITNVNFEKILNKI